RHAASVRPEPGSNSPIKFVSGSSLFQAGKSLNDRLINAFAVQFSKSIFCRTLITLSRSLPSSQDLFLSKFAIFPRVLSSLAGDKE
ncbi:hypothetical protein ACFSO0_05035, partial [Brevibacillus sp. GCM10020057]|uniref:hypothetical protein n=1 Tax=Brevibacillus sp. GCM10020057 TaxID=3317327 RepID=UPI00363DEB2D